MNTHVSGIADDSPVVGADVGGTHITAALVDLGNRSILPGTLSRVHVNAHASCDTIMEAWSKAMRAAGTGVDTMKVSLAMPGPFDYEKGICLIKGQDKYEHLYGLNIKELLSEKLNNEPADYITVNDAAAFMQGEVFGGAARGFETAIGVTLGTGLGTCIYKDHKSTNADLWSFPFRDGIAEDYLSTRWFIKRYLELTGNKATGVRELCELTETDNRVRPIFTEFGKTMAEFLEKFLNMAPAEVIIIGGNIAKSYPFFSDALLETMKKNFPQITVKTAILGEEAALLGAASQWKR